LRRWVIIAAILIVSVHGALLFSTLTDWRVTLDSGYHVSLARAYGEHGLVVWDQINFGPAGRPNLQAPLMHVAVGAIGRVMGGTGRDYVLANAMLAAMQWAAAIATAAFFALLLGGEWAMLLAVALLGGAGFAAASFAVGIPSGWLFILIPWAIDFFLRRRLVLAAVVASAAIYVHIAGLVTVPLGIAMAAVLSRRWRDLVVVGLAIAIITAPLLVALPTLRRMVQRGGQLLGVAVRSDARRARTRRSYRSTQASARQCAAGRLGGRAPGVALRGSGPLRPAIGAGGKRDRGCLAGRAAR
jgi:hypothetical protein